MGSYLTVSQNSAVNHGVEGLHPAVENFREAGNLRDALDRNLSLRQRLFSTAGGEDLKAKLAQAFGKVGYAGLIGYANNGSHNASNYLFSPSPPVSPSPSRERGKWF